MVYLGVGEHYPCESVRHTRNATTICVSWLASMRWIKSIPGVVCRQRRLCGGIGKKCSMPNGVLCKDTTNMCKTVYSCSGLR